jgi:hypothetical protein|tara:strand:- start:52 stop:201 length:150 start_codon:yes stop_codon:yes gene_type:complete
MSQTKPQRRYGYYDEKECVALLSGAHQEAAAIVPATTATLERRFSRGVS